MFESTDYQQYVTAKIDRLKMIDSNYILASPYCTYCKIMVSVN
jgi:hypothetical protein